MCDPHWTDKFRLPTVRVTGKQITAPEGEDDRKPPATEGGMDSTGTAPDEGYTNSRCKAPEDETDSKCTDPEGDADKTKGLAPNGDDADCYMIHLPTALETQIRATVVNRRHLNNRFRIEEYH
jgi:hypothetical protein